MHRRRCQLSLVLALLAACSDARSAEKSSIANSSIDGAWTSDSRHCNKVFSKRRSGIAFTKDADVYGSGFIVDDRKIRARLSRCSITRRTNEGSMIHLVASCANDIMLSDVQMSLKVIDRNKLVRIFPGLSDLQASYERCELK
jgi:hypothetical protein